MMDLARSRTRRGNVDTILYTHHGEVAATILVVYSSDFKRIISVTVANVLVPAALLAILVRNACAQWLQPEPETFDPTIDF